MRLLEILPSSVSPSVLVKLGNTHVLCNIRASVTEPHPVRQNEGFLIFKVNLDILRGMSGLKKTSKQLSNEFAEILEKTIRDSK
jgi:exosome complex RNA-binding protein Rrp42 (RNase PH superfamily)